MRRISPDRNPTRYPTPNPRHLPYLSVVEEGHEEALDKVVQVLGQDQLVVAVLHTAVVQQAALHPGAEGAEAVPHQRALCGVRG